MAGVWLGTSGFAYREWKPSFYPPKLPQRQFLEFYASQFRAVEIDSTFYRMPSSKTLDGWREATPSDFRFAIKASRKITHWERLRLPSEAVDYLTGVLPVLGERLGPVLFQLPPNFKCDAPRLELFLDYLASDLRPAFEFRHDSWFNDEVYQILGKHGAALVIHDADLRTTPVLLTADSTYVRLRKAEYKATERHAWQRRFREWNANGVDVYAFVKHEDNPDAPAVARRFASFWDPGS